MLDGRRDQVAATFRTGDIAVIRDGLASTRPNEVGDLFRYRGVLPEPRYVGPQVVHHDPGPAFGEEFDVCPPQPAACPSHDRDLPLQRNSFRHLAILFRQRLNASARNRDTDCRGAMSLWQSQIHVRPSRPAEGQLRVNRAISTVCQTLPVYPNQRTSTDRPNWSVPCQHQKSCALAVMLS